MHTVLAIGVVLALALLLTTPSAEAGTLGVHGTATGPPFWSTLWDRLLDRPTGMIALIFMILGVIAGNDQAWAWLLVMFLFALVTAVLVFDRSPDLLRDVHPSRSAAAVATGVLAMVGVLLYVLHLRRPGFFATTEIAFALAGIFVSVRAIGSSSSAWVGLGISMYGLVEGISRLVEAIVGDEEEVEPVGADPE